MFSLNKKSSRLVLGTGIAAVLFSFPFVTRAGSLFNLNIGDILVFTFRFVGIILNTIAGFFLSFAGILVDVMLNLNRLILSPENAIVRVGWAITRDIANLGFVLVIIVIAFATIIRYQQYGSQKLLIRLITAAILVNFSFAIAGIIINFTSVVTNFFLEERLGYAQGGSGSLSTTIATAFDPQKLLIESDVPSPPDPEEGGGFFTISSSAIISIVSIVFSVVFTMLAALVFFALAFMLLIRFVRLSILIILAPIAWLLWVMPATSQHFKSWWDDFFRWTFFLPAVSFFIYLSLLSAKTLAQTQEAMVRGNFTSGLQEVMVSGSQMFIVGALLMAGIIVADKLGIAGAGATLKIAKAAQNKTRGWAAKQAGRAGAGVGQALGRRALTAGTKPDKATGEMTSFAERAAGGLARIPVVGRAFRGTAERIGKAKAGMADAVEERQKGLKNITNADLINRGKSATRAANPITASATVAELAKRGLTDKVGDESLARLLKGVQDTGTAKKVLSSRPDLAPQLEMTIEEAMQSFKAGKAEDIDKNALKNLEVVVNLSPSHLNRIGSHGSTEQKDNVRKAIDNAINKIEALSTKQQQALNRVSDFVEQNPNWQS